MEETKLCTPYHTINGVVPEINDLHFDQMICDCKRVLFFSERCNCPAAEVGTYELKSKPNE